MLVSEATSRVKSKFEGGNSISADWYMVFKEAGEALYEKINPRTLQRIVPVYGGVSDGIVRYYCPNDVQVPTMIVNLRDRTEVFKYTDPNSFHQEQEVDKFTIEYVNGKPFLLVRKATATSGLEVDDFESVGSKSGVALTPNSFNFLNGAGALQGTFSDTLTDVEETLATAIDITDYKEGIALVPMNFEDANKVASVQLQLITDASNYYTMTTVGNESGDNIIDGWNALRFELQGATATGTPTDTNITKYKLIITMNTGESQTVIIDSLNLYTASQYYFGYYSSHLFKDKTDGSMKENADDDSDIINLERREAGILVYEACRIVAFQATKAKAKAKEDFVGVLREKYGDYWGNTPSLEVPLSYDGSPDISKSFNTQSAYNTDDI